MPSDLPAPLPASALADADPACAAARREREAVDASLERLRTIRRQLVDAGRLTEAAARDADRHAVADRKEALVAAYRAAIAEATDDGARRRAAATWMRQVSETNGRTRLAHRQLARGRQQVADLEAELRAADLEAAAARVRAEVAEAACAEARLRRATAEEAAVRSEGRDRAAVVSAAGDDGVLSAVAELGAADAPDEPIDADGGAVFAVARRPVDSPTVRRLLAGDPGTHQAIAAELAEMSGQLPARYLLLLDTLVNELSAAAIDAGELAFDHEHPLWGQFSADEARLVIRGLRDLGFRLDLDDGWFGGRAPTASDLASALGFAGYDVRSLRGVPSGATLRDLPGSVQVAVHDHLRRTAPDLTLVQMVRALGPRAPRLGELWDEWGRVRPLLLVGATPTDLAIPA